MKYTNSHVVIPGLTGNLLSIWKVLPLAAVVVLLAACGDDSSDKTAGGTEEDAGIIAIENKTVSGVSQKGPFVNGSSVTIQALNGETLAQTGRSYQGKIKNDQGEFSVSIESLVSPYVVLKANGFYRNENTGEKTKAPVELFALSDISNRDEVNVNLLTHLEYERSLYLASVDSMTVAAAKKQAEKEVLTSFGIEGDFANSEDLSIFGKGDESAALLAISILMQGDLNEADFSERLADYAADIEVDGKWDDAKTATEIADWGAAKSLGQSLSYIRTKITDWGLSAEVPAFEKYVDNYWWQNYGLGTCEENREGEIKKNENSQSRNYKSYFICENGAWRVASDTEYDTYQQKCDEDGKIVFGNINKAYAYDCDAQRWRHASNVEAALGGCVEKRFSEVAETEGVYYICQKREWRTTTDIEKDTYGWDAGKDGEVRAGQINKTIYYIYETSKNAWRNATTLEKDTYDHKNNKDWANGVDGEIKKGSVTDTIYVFDETTWRVADGIEKTLGGCVAAIQDSMGKVGNTYYICNPRNWIVATALQYDTYKKECLTEGSIVDGNVILTNKYVCDDGVFRAATENDLRANLGCTSYTRGEFRVLSGQYSYYKCEIDGWLFTTEKLNQGMMTDNRDGHVYKTIGIKEQMWMAENLNYADSVNYPSMLERNWCLEDNDSCAKYGPYYTWSSTIDSIYWLKQGKICGDKEDPCDLPNVVQGICPDGWHVPSISEWHTLYSAMGNKYKAMQAKGYPNWDKATDEYGFSVLPVGYYSSSNHQIYVFYNAYFWSSSENDNGDAWDWNLNSDNAHAGGYNMKQLGYSVRCVMNEE